MWFSPNGNHAVHVQSVIFGWKQVCNKIRRHIKPTTNQNDGKCDLVNISIIFSNLSNIMIAFNPVFFFSVSHRCHINSPSHLNCPLCPQKELSESSNFSKVCCSSWKFLDLSRTLKHPCPNNLFPFWIFETISLVMKNIPCCQLPKKEMVQMRSSIKHCGVSKFKFVNFQKMNTTSYNPTSFIIHVNPRA